MRDDWANRVKEHYPALGGLPRVSEEEMPFLFILSHLLSERILTGFRLEFLPFRQALKRTEKPVERGFY
jgi:hypothetical protein